MSRLYLGLKGAQCESYCDQWYEGPDCAESVICDPVYGCFNPSEGCCDKAASTLSFQKTSRMAYSSI
jgi:hypothetical protein